MTSAAIQKAAMLLASLDPGTAGELLKAARPETVTQIAAELVYQDATGRRRDPTQVQPMEEFFGLLHSRKSGATLEGFVRKMLASAVGDQKGEEIITEARRLLDSRDPFLSIRSADVQGLARALEGENPQVAAVVLIELPPDKSAALIPLLEEPVRKAAACRMVGGEGVSPEARARIAAMVRQRLESASGAAETLARALPQERLRRVALLLRKLKTDLRDNLVQSIAEQDAQVGVAVRDLMVTWVDIRIINDRHLQDVLRNVEARTLALALVGADPQAVRKVRANISERAGAMIDEETALMKKPKAEEVEAAREAVLGLLRERNAAGELAFEEH